MAIYKTEVIPGFEVLPHAPGIYFFRNHERAIIYVGKAVDLWRRVRSYFDTTHEDSKTTVLVSHIATIDYIQTKSEFEALLLEAKYIRSLQPKYNILARDDKSPIYILVDQTNSLPTISTSRKPKKEEKDPKKIYFGPFSQKKTTEEILRSIRHIIPYCTQKVRNGRPCFYTHIGLCSPCPSKLWKMPEGTQKTDQTKLYQKNILRIVRILSGKSDLVLKDMETEMQVLSKEKNFEKARLIKRQFDSLLRMIQTTYEPFSFENHPEYSDRTEEYDLQSIVQKFYPATPTLTRIECIDIATLFGESTVASLVTFIDGVQDRGSYRKFKIRKKYGTSDTDAMRETLERRLNHPEWAYPDLLIVDGGKPQVSTASKILTERHFAIPLMGLAKREEQLVFLTPTSYEIVSIPLRRPAMNLLRRIRDEAHRFANTYHRTMRRKAAIPTSNR